MALLILFGLMMKGLVLNQMEMVYVPLFLMVSMLKTLIYFIFSLFSLWVGWGGVRVGEIIGSLIIVG